MCGTAHFLDTFPSQTLEYNIDRQADRIKDRIATHVATYQEGQPLSQSDNNIPMSGYKYTALTG